jgi:crotonobetainyl-CoA:carnitine CoA-transferase CaiB-like acyl-CoA transferase
MAGALDGLVVIDLSRFISGPLCGMLLADLGAEVVKVESGGGDPSRLEGPWFESESLYYAQMNRNKRGVWLDLRSPEGKEELRALIARADVVIENFRPGVIDAMGFGADDIRAINPRCILVSVSGFGQTAGNRGKGAFDAIIQSLSGLAAVTGGPDSFPLLIGTYVTDTTAALLAAIGALAAVRQRQVTGRGQSVDVSLMDAALVQLGALVPAAALTGYEPERVDNRDRTSAPANAYHAQDGWVYIHAGSDAFWERLVGVMGRDDLRDDPRFTDERGRLANREEADRIVAEWVAGRSVSAVEEALEEAGLLVSRINTVAEAVRDVELGIGDRLAEFEGASVDAVRTLHGLVRLSDSPAQVRYGVPRREPA